VRHCPGFAAIGADFTASDVGDRVFVSSRHSRIAQAATKRTVSARAVAVDIRSSLFVIISGTSARLLVDNPELSSGDMRASKKFFPLISNIYDQFSLAAIAKNGVGLILG